MIAVRVGFWIIGATALMMLLTGCMTPSVYICHPANASTIICVDGETYRKQGNR